MKALVTGATGFVGSAMARKLLQEGWDLRVLVRPNSDRRNLSGLALEVVEGDLLDAASLTAAVQGCEALFHVAADYRLWVPDPAELYQANVEGSRNLMQAAQAAGVSRIIYTSSVATLGLLPDGSPADEDTPVGLQDMVGHYKRSKFLAEQAVQTMIEQSQLPAVIVNPSTPIGPRDIKPTPTGQMIVDAVNGKMPAYVDTGLNLAHVDDVAEGHWLAYQHGVIGERYILGGENYSLQQILGEIAAIIGEPAPKLQIPHSLAMLVAYGSEAWASVSRQPPKVSIDSVKMSKKRMFFSIAKAQRVLGYQPRAATQAIADAIEWFYQHDYCQRRVSAG